MESENNLSGSVGLDTTEFKAGVTDLKNQVKAIETSFRASAAVMEDWSKSNEGLGARVSSLQDKLKLQKQALSTLNDEYKKSVEAQGANSKSAQSLANQMYSMEKQIQYTEKDLKKFNAELKLQQSGWGQLSQKMQSVSKHAKTVGKGISDAGKTMSTAFTLPLVGIGAAAANIGNEFEAQMSRVKAISGATGDEFENLTAQAKQLGQDTAFSASEAAEGMENLASAGFGTKEIMAAMPGMLDLAASSGEDLATSSDIAASTLRGFGLAADQAGHVADVLAKNAANTNAAVADTGAAMKYIAPVAQNAGWSLEQVTASIGEMADAGIKGEQAGTTLRGALTNLMNPSKAQATAMEEIGFNAYDAHGKMKSLSQIVGELEQKTRGLTDEQRDQVVATIMGTDSLSGMQVLLKDGKGNLDKLTASLKNSDGAAKNMASTMQGNTKGAIEQMKGSLETAAITVQEKLAPTITRAANAVQNLANKFAALSPAQQDTIIKIAAVVAIIGPAILIIGKMITAVGAVAGVISTVSGAIAVVATGAEAATPAVAGLASAIKFMTGQIGLTILAITAVVTAFVLLWNNCEGFRNFWIGLWNGIKSAAQAVGAWFSGPFVGFFTSAGSGIISGWQSVKTFFAGVPAWFSDIKAKGLDILTGAIDAIKEKFEQFRLKLIELKDGAIAGIKQAFESFRQTIEKNKTAIEVVAGILGTIFGPALIKSGIEAATAGAKVASGFTANLIKSGAEAIVNGAKITANFIGTMIKTGAEAAVSGAKLAVSFTGAMIKSGAEAVANGAKITVNFIGSMIQSGAEAVANGAKLAVSFTASMIEAGAQAVVSGAKVVGSFIASMVQSAAQAVVTGATITGSLITAIVAYAAEGWKAVASIAAQTASWIAQKVAMAASTVATNAATVATNLLNAAMKANPIGIVITLIAALVAALVILFNHNKAFHDWVLNAFAAIKGGAQSLVTAVSGFFTQTIPNAFNFAKAKVIGIWNGAISGITSAWNTFKTYLSNPALLLQAIQNAFSAAINWIKALPGEALQWGKDMIMGIVDGIKSAASAVGNAVEGVAQNIRSFLHFSVPDEGPLADADQWMPDFMTLLANGINTRKQQVVNAISSVAAAVSAETKSSLDKIQKDTSNDYDEIIKKIRDRSDKLRADTQSVIDDYNNQFGSLKKSIYNSTGLFSDVTKTDVTGAQLQTSLTDQVQQLKSWKEALAGLAEKGVSQDFIKELKEMGPSATDQIKALNSMAEDQLTKYVDLWKEKNELAAGAAEDQLTDVAEQIPDKIKALREEAGNDLRGYADDWADTAQGITDQLAELASKTTDYGKDMVSGLVDGIKSQTGAVQNAVKNVADIINANLHFSRPDVGPLANYETWMPDFMEGLAKGMTDNLGKVKAAARQVAGAISGQPAILTSTRSEQSKGLDNTNALIGAINMLGTKITAKSSAGKGAAPAIHVNSTGAAQVLWSLLVGEAKRLGAVGSDGTITIKAW